MPAARTGAARRYAEAVFETAKAHDSFDRWQSDLAVLVQMHGDPDIGRLLASPAVAMSAKKTVVNAYLADTSQESRNLAMLLLQKGRFELVPQIADHYQLILNEHRGIATAQVVSAVELTPPEMRAIEKRLSEITGRRIVMELSVDPSIIGGVVARVGDQLIDASVKGRLEALRKRLAS